MTNHTQAVAGLLRAAFPDPNVQITPETVSASLRALHDLAAKDPSLFEGHGFDVSGLTDPAPPSHKGADPRLVDYWIATGTHHRTSPIESSFPVQLTMPRISVSDDWEKTPVETVVGTMYAGDHKLYSFSIAEEYLKEVSEAMSLKLPVLDRVHVMSPPRSGGSRFGAIGIYLFYGEETTVPFAYALEAGMATGESRVLYFAPDFITPIVRRGFYKPTPFSDPDFFYRGHVGLCNGEISTFWVEVLKDKKSEAHLRIDLTYALVPEKDAPCVFPALLTLQAACRVAAIADAMKVPFPDLGVLTPLFAQLGRELYPWIKKPGVLP